MIDMFDREFHEVPHILLQLYGFSSGVFSRVFGVFSWGSGVFCRPANLRDQKWMYHFSPGSSAPRPSWMVSKTDHNRPTPLFSFTKMKNKCQYIYIYISIYVFTVIQIVLPIRIYICLQLHLLMFVYFQTHSKCFFYNWLYKYSHSYLKNCLLFGVGYVKAKRGRHEPFGAWQWVMWMVVPPLGPKQAQAKRLLLVRATRIGIQMDSGAAGVRTHGHAYTSRQASWFAGYMSAVMTYVMVIYSWDRITRPYQHITFCV